eukprot:TRINITY_DN1301_c0_g1_i1.p1 TRINITY_DN1301_c0_g1~~TRINITY_DN1301_c0_g1_i1.p1  ORF type:complete len:289 (+),score=32.46 TRINITY_DN1301_c0_g1_i1:48-914(+)
MAQLRTLLIQLATVSFTLSILIPEHGEPTCFSNSACIDLTNFTATSTTDQGFWDACQCKTSWQTFVSTNPEYADSVGVYVVYLYTGSLYYSVNYDLRVYAGNVPMTYYYHDQEISSGLEFFAEKYPDNFGIDTSIVWRGLYSPYGTYVEGQVHVEPTFISTSYSRSVGYNWASNTILVIANSGGRNIQPLSMFSGEDEVLFGAGYKFQVLKVDNTSSCVGCSELQRVFMYEIDEETKTYTSAQQQALLNYMIKVDAEESQKPPKILDDALLKKIETAKALDRKMRGEW